MITFQLSYLEELHGKFLLYIYKQILDNQKVFRTCFYNSSKPIKLYFWPTNNKNRVFLAVWKKPSTKWKLTYFRNVMLSSLCKFFLYTGSPYHANDDIAVSANMWQHMYIFRSWSSKNIQRVSIHSQLWMNQLLIFLFATPNFITGSFSNKSNFSFSLSQNQTTPAIWGGNQTISFQIIFVRKN